VQLDHWGQPDLAVECVCGPQARVDLRARAALERSLSIAAKSRESRARITIFGALVFLDSGATARTIGGVW
jgi:hypothetical protein